MISLFGAILQRLNFGRVKPPQTSNIWWQMVEFGGF
jgi:hypothetical protein